VGLKQAVIGLNCTIPLTNRTEHKFLLLSSQLTNIGKYIDDFYVAYDTPGLGSIVALDFSDKHAIVAVRKNTEMTTYYDMMYRFDFYKRNETAPMQTTRDVWLSQDVTSGYLNSSDDAIALIANQAVSEHTSTPHNVLALENEALVNNMVLYHPDYGMIYYTVEKPSVIRNYDKDSKVPQFYSKVNSLDGFSGSITEAFTYRLSKNTQVLAGYDSNNPKTVAAASISMIRHGPRGANLSNSNIGKIMVKPVSTHGVTQFPEYYIGKAAFSNLAISRTVTNNNANLPSLASIDKTNITPLDLTVTQATMLSTEKGLKFNDSKRLIDEPFIMQTSVALDKFSFVAADVYMHCIFGSSTGIKKIEGVYSKCVDGTRKFIPHFKNRPNIEYTFDELDSLNLSRNFDDALLMNGATLFGSYAYGAVGIGIIPFADSYVDLYNNRVLKHSSFIGANNQEEIVEGNFKSDRRGQNVTVTPYYGSNSSYCLVSKNAVDSIIQRLSQYSYDNIDHFSLYGIPYKYLGAWWIPISILPYLYGNDQQLTFTPTAALLASQRGSIGMIVNL
jgi:hypothetical protein